MLFFFFFLNVCWVWDDRDGAIKSDFFLTFRLMSLFFFFSRILIKAVRSFLLHLCNTWGDSSVQYKINKVIKMDNFGLHPLQAHHAVLFRVRLWKELSRWEDVPNGTAQWEHHCPPPHPLLPPPSLPHRPDWCVPALFSWRIIGIIEWHVVLRAKP